MGSSCEEARELESEHDPPEATKPVEERSPHELAEGKEHAWESEDAYLEHLQDSLSKSADLIDLWNGTLYSVVNQDMTLTEFEYTSEAYLQAVNSHLASFNADLTPPQRYSDVHLNFRDALTAMREAGTGAVTALDARDPDEFSNARHRLSEARLLLDYIEQDLSDLQ